MLRTKTTERLAEEIPENDNPEKSQENSDEKIMTNNPEEIHETRPAKVMRNVTQK